MFRVHFRNIECMPCSKLYMNLYAEKYDTFHCSKIIVVPLDTASVLSCAFSRNWPIIIYRHALNKTVLIDLWRNNIYTLVSTSPGCSQRRITTSPLDQGDWPHPVVPPIRSKAAPDDRPPIPSRLVLDMNKRSRDTDSRKLQAMNTELSGVITRVFVLYTRYKCGYVRNWKREINVRSGTVSSSVSRPEETVIICGGRE